MTAVPGLPAGRAGRTWLLERLRTADRAVELLRTKVRVVEREQQRWSREAEEAAAAWERAAGEAETWLLRAALLGGRSALAGAVPAGAAVARVSWVVSMGVRHPGAAAVEGSEPADTDAVPGNAALVTAATAYRTALRAAARTAAAAEAARLLSAELARTRQRLRAVEDRWVPRLTEQLRALEAAMGERELAEDIQVRWAHSARRPG